MYADKAASVKVKGWEAMMFLFDFLFILTIKVVLMKVVFDS